MKKEGYPLFIFNNNTGIIFAFVHNIEYDTKANFRAKNTKRKAHQASKKLYFKIKADDSVDYKKFFLKNKVRRLIDSGSIIPCTNLVQARFHQYMYRYEKCTNTHDKEFWKDKASLILKKNPEKII